ncbi:MAG: hypothetical protein V9E83_14250 [Baekduia sp.]
MKRSHLLSAVLACTWALMAASGAQAAGTIDVKRIGTTVVATGTVTGGEQSLTVDRGYNSFELTDNSGGVTLTSSNATCTVASNTVTCGNNSYSITYTTASLDLHASTADLDILDSDAPNGIPAITITSGSGDDELRSINNDGAVLNAGAGADTLECSTPYSGATPTCTANGDADDDTFTTDSGGNTLNGGSGDDLFIQDGYGATNADRIDGGGDSGSPGADLISYSKRSNAVVVTLPPESQPTPTGSNGEAGEFDWLAHMEGVIGGEGGDTLNGNERRNLIDGRDGSDILRGEGGDDIVEARAWETSSDVDRTIDCGGGSDRLKRDRSDATPVSCESIAPGFTTIPAITGTAEVGQTLTLGGYTTFGDPGTVTVEWYSELSGDEPIATGPSLLLTPNLDDDFVWARLTITDGSDTARVVTDDRYVGSVSSPWPVVRTPAPTTTTPVAPVAPDPLQLAITSLGAGTTAFAAPNVPPVVSVYRSQAAAGKTITYKRGSSLNLYGVYCQVACTTRSRLKLSIKPKGKRKKTRLVTLPYTRTVPAQGVVAVTPLKLGSKDVAAVKRSKTTTLTIELVVIGLPDRRGVPVTIKRVHTLKIA